MNDSPLPLDAVPPDPTPDIGPLHRGGPFTYFVVLFCGLTAFGAGILLYRQGLVYWAGACLVALGGLAIRAGFCVAERLRHHGSLPRSHAVLTDSLGFRIHCTCRDVAATVFFDPDSLQPGAPTRLLCFLENYASRQRLATLRIGPHRDLGLPQPLTVSLHLAAGQAAVYILPLAVAPSLAPGEHDIPVTLRARKPAGTGVRLRGTRRHLYDLWTVRFAAPFTVAEPSIAAPAAPAAAPQPARFLTLASVSETAPRLATLQALGSD